MAVRFYLVLASLLFCFTPMTVSAADTTWVQAHHDIWLPSSPKNLDTTIEFPDGTKSYRKIYMIFTLGKYQCPGTPQYCGDWDYTVQNFLMTPNGDTVELGRLITPYANASNPRTPWTWQQRYVFDVTDYYPLLKDTATVRVHYSGYSGGFTANVKFAFIEGTPPRNVLKIQRLWHGSFRFGDTAAIDTKIKEMNLNADVATQFTEMKLNITGHGSDDNYCSEFCKKHYKVILNKSIVEQRDIWRDDCGFNHLYPQTGTWVYDRGNWCPGDLVYTNSHKLAGIAPGSGNYDLDIDFESYTGSKNNPNTSWGSYIIDAAVIDYGAFNRNLDATLEDIIAPSNNEMHFRQNPFTGNPIIRVVNTGATAITSLKIVYTSAGITNVHTWTGNLNSLESVNITLPEIFEIRYLTGSNNTFAAQIAEVNGQADEDNSNNDQSSVFTAAPNWPMNLKIRFRTNSSQVGGFSESAWYIIEAGKDTVARREFNQVNKLYEDTIKLGPSYYYLVVKDDGCDGLKWWANSAAGNGFITVAPLETSLNLPLDGYFSGDFGCGFTQRFNVTWPLAVSNINETSVFTLDVYPNPASNSVHINIRGIEQIDGNLAILDAVGRVVALKHSTTAYENIDISYLSNGIYTVRFTNKNDIKLQTRLVIAR